jgi:hypothetical protein
MNHSDPYVFSRGSLKLTYDLLRPINPSLALVIRNITSLSPLPKLEGDVDNSITDCFLVDISSFQVRAVVKVLIKRSQVNILEDAGTKVVAQALLENWQALANEMLLAFDEINRIKT